MSYGAPEATAVNAVLAAGYTPPSATAVNAVLSKSGTDYGAPEATAVNAVLAAGYTPPAATAVNAVLLRDLRPGIYPLGIFQGAFGTATLSLRTISLAGIAPGSFGTPSIILKTRFCTVGGIAPPPQTGVNNERQIPSPTVDYRTKILAPAGIPAVAFPTHYIADYYQFIDLAGTGSSDEAIGTLQVSNRYRSVEPYFIASNIFGTPSVTFKLVVAPAGWDSSIISEENLLEINTRRIRHGSGNLDPAKYGEALVLNRVQRVSVGSVFPEGLGFPVVWNKKQRVVAGAYENTYADPTLWPPYAPYVSNKNRTLVTQGHRSSRFSALGHGIRNKARVITPGGIDSIQWGEATDVGHRIRYLLPAPVGGAYLSPYAIVYNSARAISFTIPQTSSVGVPSLVNRNRYLPVSSITSSNAFGVPFTAFRIRYLVAYSCTTPFTPIPEVRHNPYPISPLGIPPQGFGAAQAYTQYNGIFPAATNVHQTPWLGKPLVQNRNKSVIVTLYDQSDFGRTLIENRIKYVAVGAGPQTVLGAVTISRRTKILRPTPLPVPQIVWTHRIRNVIPDPPGIQIVLAESIFIGYASAPGIIPAPILFPVRIYPDGINQSGFGTAVLTRNQINVGRGIFNADQVGIPSLSGTQYCYPRPIPWPNSRDLGESDLQWGAIRLSPHTIYAPSADQATAQAVANHPRTTPHKIGEGEADGSNWPVFGHLAVSNKNRTIGPVPLHSFVGSSSGLPALHTRYGTPDIQLRRRYILARGVRPARFGFTAILGGDQSINLNDPSAGIAAPMFDTAHSVAPPYEAPLPAFYPVGLAPPSIDGPRVDLFNREITPQGIPHRGNPEQDLTSPWGDALIGYPRPYVIGGYIMTLWGTARVEHRIRTVYAHGFESLSLVDYALGGFSDRMRVSRRNPPGSILGIPPGAMGSNVGIGFRVRTVGAHSAAGAGYGVPSLAMLIKPSGWLSTVFGDIDRWEAGKIKPYGPDVSSLGTPRMVHTLRPSGGDMSLLGAPRMARSVIMSGMPPIGFAGPSITDMTGCNNRVVVVLPIAALTISSPVVGPA